MQHLVVQRVKRSIVRGAVPAFLAVLALPSVASSLVFSDDFEDGDISDWVLSSNYGGVSNLAASNAYLSAGDYAMAVYFDVPPFSNYSGLYTRATRTFSIPSQGDYSLDASVYSLNCDGCIIYADILVDGVLVSRTSTGQALVPVSIPLNSFSAGVHTLSLGVYATVSYSGRFVAAFDNVVILSPMAVPEPSTAALLMLGISAIVWRSQSRSRANT